MAVQDVYDFLYVDVKRIARLVAQLDGRGLLQETSRQLASEAGATAKLNIVVAELGASPKISESEGSKFDPSWRLPIVFLEELREHVVSDPDQWKIGQLVTISGSIQLLDFAFARELLAVKALEVAMLREGFGRDPMTQTDMEAFKNATNSLPNLLQVLISNGKMTTWSTVNNAFTTASSGDLILKCGHKIQGTWTMYGILDALIEVENPTTKEDVHARGKEFANLAEAARDAFGRPHDCFGVTPLTIHRRVEIPTTTSVIGKHSLPRRRS